MTRATALGGLLIAALLLMLVIVAGLFSHGRP